MITADSTLREVAFIVCTALQHVGVTAVPQEAEFQEVLVGAVIASPALNQSFYLAVVGFAGFRDSRPRPGYSRVVETPQSFNPELAQHDR